MRRIVNISAVSFAAIVVFLSCGKNESFEPGTVPSNPFDTITPSIPPSPDQVDSASFLGLHQYIFSTTCAVPGCHDGHFEPDFRSVQSSYNTMVNHAVEKNNAAEEFTYRVVPGDSKMSWLYERITTEDGVLGRMPLYDTLSNREIELIKNWIEDGAKDIFGNSPTLPTQYPQLFGVLAFENDTNGIRHDSARASIIDPMEFPDNTTMDIWIGLYDLDANGAFNWGNALSHNKYNISNNLYQFNSSNEKDMTVEDADKYYLGPIPFGQPGEQAWYYQHFKINTADFPNGQTQYFRIYVKDDDHTNITEIPADGSQVYLLTYFSFVVR